MKAKCVYELYIYLNIYTYVYPVGKAGRDNVHFVVNLQPLPPRSLPPHPPSSPPPSLCVCVCVRHINSISNVKKIPAPPPLCIKGHFSSLNSL